MRLLFLSQTLIQCQSLDHVCVVFYVDNNNTIIYLLLTSSSSNNLIDK